MKFYYGLLIMILTASCDSEKSKSDVSLTNAEKNSVAKTDSIKNEIPVGAIQERYEDKPGLVRAIVNEGLNLSQQGNFLNGKLEGTWCEFYPNGILKSTTSYVNGIKEGLYMELNPSGQLTKRYFYHNNMRHGEYKEFFHSTLKEQRNYQNGKLEGLVKIYYDNGILMEDGMYQNGLREGVSKWYDQNGKVSITYEYKNGELVKK